MAHRADMAREEIFNTSRFNNTTAGLFRLAGGWGNVSGPGIFMLRVMLSGSAAAVFTGMTGAVIGHFIWGTSALPFIASCCTGFCLGTVGFYADSLSKALLTLDLYPSLLRFHLDANYPKIGFRRWRTEDRLRSEVFKSSWTLRSMLVVAWLTAQPALDQIMESEEEALVEQEKEKSGAPTTKDK